MEGHNLLETGLHRRIARMYRLTETIDQLRHQLVAGHHQELDQGIQVRDHHPPQQDKGLHRHPHHQQVEIHSSAEALSAREIEYPHLPQAI